jgi:hypothetical protein
MHKKGRRNFIKESKMAEIVSNDSKPDLLEEVITFLADIKISAVLLKDLSGNALAIDSVWRKCNGPVFNKNKSFYQIDCSDGINFIINAIKNNNRLKIYVLNEWISMIYNLWPYIEDFFSGPEWKTVFAQFIIGKNSGINRNLYPSIDYVLYCANEDLPKDNNVTWNKVFNLLIAKRIILQLKSRFLSQFNVMNTAVKDMNIDNLSINTFNTHRAYRIFMDSVLFMQTILNQKQTLSSAVSYIDSNFFSKISILQGIDFIGAVCDKITALIEKADSDIKSLAAKE